MAQDLRRIVISGETANEIQGIGLRESIERIAKSIGAKGIIRNVKGKALVEIICEASKADQLCDALVQYKKGDGGKFDVSKPMKELFDEFREFSVAREDDLTEMVWGLQGAGRAFMQAEKDRENNRRKRIMMGLKVEISSISDQISDAKSGIGSFRLFCIENFLKEPPTGDDMTELLSNLDDLWTACKETNDLMPRFSEHNARSRIEENIKKIEGMVGTINRKLGDEDGI